MFPVLHVIVLEFSGFSKDIVALAEHHRELHQHQY